MKMKRIQLNKVILGHLHGHGLLDVLVGRQKGKILIAAGKVRSHHVFPKSSWISFQLESIADVPFALELLTSDYCGSFKPSVPLLKMRSLIQISNDNRCNI